MHQKLIKRTIECVKRIFLSISLIKIFVEDSVKIHEKYEKLSGLLLILKLQKPFS